MSRSRERFSPVGGGRRLSEPGRGGISAGWLGLLLAAVTLAAYLPSLRAGFIWDDDSMLTRNSLIRAADGLARFWGTAQAADYWPVTSSTLWVEWRLWGMRAMGYHATNLVLHIVAALLLWRVLRRLRLPGAFFAALIFAVHPVNVESVAWIAERKNLLAMIFFLASIFWFSEWLERVVPNALTGLGGRPSALGTMRSTGYWLSLAAFILALLSKGSVAMLPVVLAGLIAWRRRLAVRDFVRLAPFFLVAAILAGVDVWFQKQNSAQAIRSADLLDRILGAGAVVWFYLGKALWPVNLAFVYPAWRIDAGSWRWWLPGLAAIAVTVVLCWWARLRLAEREATPRQTSDRFARSETWRRGLLFGWGYFCVMLVPVMGLTDVYFMKYSLVADHYEHLAMVGVVALLAAAWGQWWESAGGAAASAHPGIAATGVSRRPLPTVPLLVAGLTIAVLSVMTWRQCRIYLDDETLFRATLARNPGSWMVQNDLGTALLRAGKNAEALPHFEEALRLEPDDPEAHYNLGVALASVGQNRESIGQYEKALALKPNYAAAEGNLGAALTVAGRLPEAIIHYEKALRLEPNDPVAHNNLGTMLARTGRLPEALGHFETAVRLDPGSAQARNNLGFALFLSGRLPEAMSQFEEALRLDPGLVQARDRLELVRQRLAAPAGGSGVGHP